MSKYQHILDHYQQADPTLYQIMTSVDFEAWLNPRQKFRTNNYFLALCREIIGQQLSSKAANSIFERFVDHFKTSDLQPQDIFQAKDQDLRSLGLSGSKVKYINGLASAVAADELDLKSLGKLEDSAVITKLTKIKGIGPWTAEMFLMFTLGRENIFSHGDLGLRKGIIKVYNIEDPAREQVEQIVTPWEPYKTYGSITLWNALDMQLENA